MQRAFFTLFSALVALSSSLAAFGQGMVGNGGDAVDCRTAANSPFDGLYSLDYLLTYQSSEGDSGLAPVASWEASRDRIASILTAAHPDLAYSFASFVAGLDNHSDWSQARIWREASFGLINIQDERVIRRLPENCYTQDDAGSINVIQAVIRTKRPESVVYEYDPAMLDQLRRTPIQLSFLLVHEWLWDLTDDVRIIRDMDRFLHSRSTETLTPEAFHRAVENIGLSLRPAAWASVCDRSRSVQDAISRVSWLGGTACAAITPASLASPGHRYIEMTVYVPSEVKELGLDDFAGMSVVGGLTISGNLQHVYAHQFDHLVSLEWLGLAENDIHEIDLSEICKIGPLAYIDLRGNPMTPEARARAKASCDRILPIYFD